MPLAFLLMRATVDYGFGPVTGYAMGLYGAWVAMFFDLMVRGGLFATRFAGGRWKRIKV